MCTSNIRRRFIEFPLAKPEILEIFFCQILITLDCFLVDQADQKVLIDKPFKNCTARSLELFASELVGDIKSS